MLFPVTGPDSEMDDELKVIFDCFETEGTYLRGEPFGNGHIHDTFRIMTSEKTKDDYILQRMNNLVFRNIPELQHNILRVTLHLRNKLSSIHGSDLKRECLRIVPAKDGRTWVTDKGGKYWRMFIFITNHRSYDVVDSPGKAYEGGKAIGRFQAMLADLRGEPLFETIPGFHDVEKRLDCFNSAVFSDPAGRVKRSFDEIHFINERAEKMKVILRLGREGKIPLRITHNDTKFNNILLDENDRALCVIDLDTVMPGYVHYDFGDAVRTAANVACEDEKDLTRVRMDIGLFRAYASGYLSETKHLLNEVEKEYLAFAPCLITYTIALRFLTDYINGDHYFKIHHRQHNLQRARSQMKLLKSMEDQYEKMLEIIMKLS